LVEDLFSALSKNPIYCYSDNNLRIANHLNGIKQLGRKNLLAKNIYKYMADNNLDDTKVLPRTFFINEEDCQENL